VLVVIERKQNMNHRILTVVAAVTLATWAGAASTAHALWPYNSDYCAASHACQLPWHGGFYDPTYGQPIALVVPPNAETQTNWGWGVGNTRTSPIYHQFGRNYPGMGPGFGGAFAPTPPWPSDTTQFGVYYVRGPW
jgi:hypothetical protein